VGLSPLKFFVDKRDSSPSSLYHQSVLRAIDWLIAREKHICLLGPSSPIDPTHMVLKLDLMCGNRGPFFGGGGNGCDAVVFLQQT
jgi:hypothetical protein